MSSPYMKHHHNNPHTPVLIDQVLSLLEPKAGESYIDLTAGYGSHASAVIDRTKRQDLATLVDRDQTAIDYLNREFKDAQLIHSDYLRALKQAHDSGQHFDLLLMDLGVSSLQLDQPERGFSFQSDARLDMRMDQTQKLNAHDVVNSYTLSELTKIIKLYGEEPRAGIIAKSIVDARPLDTTKQLSELISKVIYRRGRTNPATRTFQAIRMEVNDELGQLESALEVIPRVMKSGSRMAVISFHSLEDRLVKSFIKGQEANGLESILKSLTKKPISGTEDVNNPRARSAKLRAALFK